ncbi:glycosyltransferase [Ureibacillus terrenus]|uniref:glycosyltransferase n=1 Tax=Ureibacillus terrenus TaxID=118246 RepID=UPI002E248175|nr:glycosyltransferase [Ureibacillus terrenus]
MKILYVTTISNTVNTFLIPHIKMLIEEGHEVHCAFNIVQEVNEELIKMGCKIHNIEFQRSPLRKENIKAYKNLKKLIQNERYDLIHTHTPVASACVRLACKKNK